MAPSVNANRLHEDAPRATVDFLPEQPQKPLTGTKLYQTPQKQLSPRRAHNSLMEAVENQRYAARYEAPGATLPQSAELREVHNPADALKRALQRMWQSTETQRQAVDVLLNQPGMRAMLSKALSKDTNDLTVAAMQSQLQEMEAERLMTLMQLDDVKKNLSAAREEAIGKLNMAEQKKLDELHIAQQQAQNALDEITKALEPIENKREEASRKMEELQSAFDAPVYFLCPPTGGRASKQELIDRVEKAMKAAGFLVQPGDAQAMLTAFSLSAQKREMQFRAETEADAQTALEAFAAALGTQVRGAAADGVQSVVIPGGNAPLFQVHWGSGNKVDHPLVFSVSLDLIGDANAADGWFTPHADLIAHADPQAIPQPLPVFAPVSLECIQKEMLKDEKLSDETLQAISAVRKAVAEAGHPLPLAAVDMMCRFIAATQEDLGVAQAIDRAVAMYAVAHVLDYDLDTEALKHCLAAMPRAMKALNA